MNKALVALLALPLLALGACTSTYAVDVRNRTPQPISVELLARDTEGNLAWIAQPVRLGPGDRGGAGPTTIDANRHALVRVDTPGNPGRPVMLDLRPGGTVVEVTQEGTTASGPLHITELPREGSPSNR